MSNDLELPDSPKTVIRTYSNAARGSTGPPTPNPSLLMMAINNNIKDKEDIEMRERPSIIDIEIHSDEKNFRWHIKNCWLLALFIYLRNKCFKSTKI